MKEREETGEEERPPTSFHYERESKREKKETRKEKERTMRVYTENSPRPLGSPSTSAEEERRGQKGRRR